MHLLRSSKLQHCQSQSQVADPRTAAGSTQARRRLSLLQAGLEQRQQRVDVAHCLVEHDRLGVDAQPVEQATDVLVKQDRQRLGLRG